MIKIHLYGQLCIECKQEIQPGERFHSLNGEPGRPVDFVHEGECPICKETK